MSKHHTWLHKQIDQWVGDGLMDGEMAQTLRRRYPLEGRGWGRLILSSLGAIIFGLGVILLIAYNWEAMPKFAKLGVIFGSLTAAHGLALLVNRKGSAPAAAEGLHALGTMLFGAAIWLVAQIYHIEDHYPNAMLIWGLGALALGWALPSVTQALMAVTLLLVWQAMEVFDFANNLHGVPWLILIGVFPLFWRLKSAVLGGTALIALLTSLTIVTIQLDEELPASVLLLVSTAAIGFARLLEGLSDARLAQSASAFSLPGHAVFLFIVYLLSFPGISGELFDVRLQEPMVSGYFFGALATATLIWGWVLSAPASGRSRTWRVTDLVILAGCAVAVFFSFEQLSGSGWYTALPFNLLLLAYSVLLIVFGSRQVRLHKVVVGCILLALLAAARYVDLFDSLITRAMVFFVVGGLLFAVGNLYSRQKKEQGGHQP